MIIMGAGVNHWYNNDVTYRGHDFPDHALRLSGRIRRGWGALRGQEKVRPLAGWTTVTVGSDWMGPPRLHNGTSFYYFALDSWRHELLSMDKLTPPDRKGSLPDHPADCNALAARLGWLPFYPQFKENSLETCEKAVKAGATSNEEIVAHTLERLKSGDLELSVDAPDDPANVPRVMVFWRANPLGSNVKGHEYFLKYLLGTESSFLGEEARQPETIRTTPEPDSPEGVGGGKLDLMVTSEIRMSTTCVYSDIVLPAAHWYEYHDLSSTDMHPFIHPFNPATDPAWEARTNWDQFKAIAQKFSELAGKHLGVRKDMVATALLHDTPGEIGPALRRGPRLAQGDAEPYPARRCLISRLWSGPIPTSTRCTPRSAPTSPSPAAWARRVCRGRARRNTNSLRRVSAWFPSRASAKVCPASTTPRTPVKSCWPCPRKAMAM